MSGNFRQNYAAEGGVAITPSDTATFPPTTRVFVGGAGNLTVRMLSGALLTFTGVLAGAILPIAVTQVRSTGTTATNIVALT